MTGGGWGEQVIFTIRSLVTGRREARQFQLSSSGQLPPNYELQALSCPNLFQFDPPSDEFTLTDPLPLLSFTFFRYIQNSENLNC